MANSVDPDQTAPLGCLLLYLSVMLGNYMQHISDVFFMPPKELWEAYSNRTVRPSVRQSVRPSVRPAFVSGPYLLYSLR